MAEIPLMFGTSAGFLIGLGVLLFMIRGRRLRGTKTSISGSEGKKVKKYGSDGKPIYE